MEKRQEIELLRILSAFGIVWFHSMSIGKDIAYAGLISFLILATYFSARPGAHKKSVLERTQRLLLPWAFWFLFYGLLNIKMQHPFLDIENGVIPGILTGTSIHLWYIPFIFLVTVFFDLIKIKMNSLIMIYSSALLIILMCITTGFWRMLDLNAPWEQYLHALNGVLIGVLLANSATIRKGHMLFLLLLIIVFIAVFCLSYPGVGLTYLIGIAATSLVLIPHWNLPAWLNLSWLSDCTFGIYLSHVFWLLVLRKIGFPFQLGLPFIAFGISALTVWLAKKYLPKISRFIF